MAGSSSTTTGASSGYSDQETGQEEQVKVVDQRKRKRMLSNRESARRSRMRKQQHMDELVSQVGDLKKENSQIITSLNMTNQLYLNLEAENSVLRAQMAELTHRLQSLNEIIDCINSSTISTTASTATYPFDDHDHLMFDDQDSQMMMMMMINPWNSIPLNQPIMAASADQMYMY
ncbi:bZIP transcription factor 2-like [Humulus lupulus]|uniref:bZIP transcription factor 2-like n=1 Tax=Humulus lupulus TaxID=3486 RepID=UPI002B41857E|nr:bZIP transcription factor 2-like [Humulus lupulus]